MGRWIGGLSDHSNIEGIKDTGDIGVLGGAEEVSTGENMPLRCPPSWSHSRKKPLPCHVSEETYVDHHHQPYHHHHDCRWCCYSQKRCAAVAAAGTAPAAPVGTAHYNQPLEPWLR
ncbi:hypothetical protein RJ639_031669 [Escallonia herrerae]|uniref:Uncharacterized protein n=1 Tax=Escallonia herrerae TaxID=1293975 RepID=A0AA88X0Y2_9ASTE|nr:hypothetical protein RJ639_031669 [Escallonia herrerae]